MRQGTDGLTGISVHGNSKPVRSKSDAIINLIINHSVLAKLKHIEKLRGCVNLFRFKHIAKNEYFTYC